MRRLPDTLYLALIAAFLVSLTVFVLSIFRIVDFLWWGFAAAAVCSPTAYLIARESWDPDKDGD